MEKILNNKWLKVGLLAVVGLLLAGGMVWAGYWYGQKSKLPASPAGRQLKTQNLTPTLMPVVTSLPTLSLEPTLSPDEMVGWKTHNSPCGFIIKYPPDWTIDKLPFCGWINAPNCIETGGSCLSLKISTWTKGSKIGVSKKGTDTYTYLMINTPEDFINAYKYIYAERMSEVKDKTYGSLSGKEFTYDLQMQGAFYTYFVFLKEDKDKYIYTIDWDEKYVGTYRDEIGLILSTFKFLD